MFNIEEQVKKLPKSPGVYIMKDKNGVIIYIGKSKDLSKRVKSYFRSFKSKRLKVQTMVKNVHEFEYFITDTEQEALILEANLIKKHMPRFNILLRDDKKYPYICVSLSEEYPRVFMTRDLKKDGNRYFGPYTSAYAVHTTIDAINNSFNIRKCNRDLSKSYERPCLNFHIKKCLGPCTGRVNHEEYMEKVNEIIEILDGNQSILMDALEEQMKTAAADLNFEIAADYRDKIDAIKALQEKQRINSVKGEIYDVISYYQTDDQICIMVFFIRGGNLIGRDKFTFDSDKVGDVLSSFILQFYSGIKMIPKNILVKEAIEDQGIIENWLSDIKGKKVTITVPKIGEKKKQVDLVTKNAKEFVLKFEEKINFEKKFINSSLGQLKKLLDLDDLHRIEAFDISNIYGVYSVGSMVVYENGKKKSNAYRRFKIKTVEGSDDYTSMQEVIYRRFRRGKDELDKINKNELTVDHGKFNVFPDLLLIDGGKGHVNVVQKVLDALNIDIPVCGMVKDDFHKTRGLCYHGEEIHFGQNRFAYQLVYKIQEEVHRFAINYHKSLRRSNMTKSVLDEISGIGESRKIALMKHFEKIENVKKASVEELCEVNGISEKIADKIYSFFNS